MKKGIKTENKLEETPESKLLFNMIKEDIHMEKFMQNIKQITVNNPDIEKDSSNDKKAISF